MSQANLPQSSRASLNSMIAQFYKLTQWKFSYSSRVRPLKRIQVIGHVLLITTPTFEMFLGCLGTSSKAKTSFNNKSKFFKEVTTRLIPQEINILTLIYEDLASRNPQKLLTFENFLSFFDLTGLWGTKLFEQFDMDQQELISLDEFLYGISRTAKATFQEKIKILYSFFKDDEEDGIEFKNFTKMLYNYSKQELKEILVEDEVFTSKQKTQVLPSKKIETAKPRQVIEVEGKESTTLKKASSFDLAYQYLMQSHDEGTYYQVTTNDLTFKVKYSNMYTLINQFAAKVYQEYGIDLKLDKHSKLRYAEFSSWIRSHKKLFRSYYSTFHTNIWEYQDGAPAYANAPKDLKFSGKMQCGEFIKNVYAFQVGDTILVCENSKKTKCPFKVICLEGLKIQETEGLGIEIIHVADSYQNVIFHFEKSHDFREWMKHLKIYEHDGLHSNYFTGDVIGTGRFSIVYKCIEKATHKAFALKVIDLQKLTPQGRKFISNQSKIMKVLNHPQIVKYKETIRTKTFEYIITEYIYGEDLFEYVKKRQFLNEFESAFIIGNIMKAVIFLHSMGIMHRDLKPENIMVMFMEKKDNEYFDCTTPSMRKGQRIENIKIIDFGLSNHFQNLKKIDRKALVQGTPNYISPQVLLCQQPTLKSDNFAIGGILYFLLRGRLPFAEGSDEKTVINTVRGDYDLEGEHWNKISYEAKDLLIRLLEVEPENRIDLEEAVNHEWFGAVRKAVRSNTISMASEKDNEDVPSAKALKRRKSFEEENKPSYEETHEDSVRYSK